MLRSSLAPLLVWLALLVATPAAGQQASPAVGQQATPAIAGQAVPPPAVASPAQAANETRTPGPAAPEPDVRAALNDHGDTSLRAALTSLPKDLRNLSSRATWMTIGLGGALALAARPADTTLTRSANASEPLDHVLEAGETLGSSWMQAGGAFATLALGHATGNRRVQALGSDLVRAQVLTQTLTQAIKYSVQRRRPDADRYSFPSGHSSATFATATVLEHHFGWKVGVPAYAAAAYVAASRLQENRHYASDVVFGAALGLVAGRTVTVGRGRAKFEVLPSAMSGGLGITFVHVGTEGK